MLSLKTGACVENCKIVPCTVHEVIPRTAVCLLFNFVISRSCKVICCELLTVTRALYQTCFSGFICCLKCTVKLAAHTLCLWSTSNNSFFSFWLPQSQHNTPLLPNLPLEELLQKMTRTVATTSVRPKASDPPIVSCCSMFPHLHMLLQGLWMLPVFSVLDWCATFCGCGNNWSFVLL